MSYYYGPQKIDNLGGLNGSQAYGRTVQILANLGNNKFAGKKHIAVQIMNVIQIIYINSYGML